jgi:hypothetical protein
MKLRKFFTFLLLYSLPFIAVAATYYTSPNMGLTVPAPGQELGPQWANDINASLTLIDAHDHSPGKGVPITPSGMNITSNLGFNGNFITGLGAEVYTAQSGDPTSGYSTYTKGVDLYYKDGNGNVVQITSGGGVNGSPGSISNLTSPASASFVSASGTFVWQQAASTAANMDAGTLIIRYPGSYPSPSGNYIAIEAPASLATGFALTLPASLPGSQSFMTMDTSGNITAPISTTQGITQGMLATKTFSNPAPLGGVASSTVSGTASGGSSTVSGSVTLTTAGRPVFLGFSAGSIAVLCLSSGCLGINGGILISDGSSVVCSFSQGFTQNAAAAAWNQKIPASSLSCLVAPSSAGTHTYTISISTGNANSEISLSGTMYVYEI